jgi:5-formyltetrahydrofolate cyclo-ligase
VECPPLPVTSLDFALVPGIAFDGLGGRLGRGKGFYDRLLSQAVGVTCGLGLDEQFLACVPVEAHDIRMNLIAVPAGLHEARAMD